MFYFAVKYFGFLKQVPLCAHVFESLLKLQTLIIKPDKLDCFDRIIAEVATWKGVTESSHKYGGIQFDLPGRELGHIHGNGILDIPLNRKLKQELMTERKIRDHHVFVNTGWISFHIQSMADYAYAVKLLSIAYQLKQKDSLTAPNPHSSFLPARPGH